MVEEEMKESVSPLHKPERNDEFPRQIEYDKQMILNQSAHIRSAVLEPVKEKKIEEESPRKSTTREPRHRSQSPNMTSNVSQSNRLEELSESKVSDRVINVELIEKPRYRTLSPQIEISRPMVYNSKLIIASHGDNSSQKNLSHYNSKESIQIIDMTRVVAEGSQKQIEDMASDESGDIPENLKNMIEQFQE